MFSLPVPLPGVPPCEFPRPLPMAMRLALCAALASAPSGAGAGFPYTLEWKRLTGLPAGPVAWVDSLLFLAEADGFLVAVERGSGAVRWRLPGGGPSATCMCPATGCCLPALAERPAAAKSPTAASSGNGTSPLPGARVSPQATALRSSTATTAGCTPAAATAPAPGSCARGPAGRRARSCRRTGCTSGTRTASCSPSTAAAAAGCRRSRSAPRSAPWCRQVTGSSPRPPTVLSAPGKGRASGCCGSAASAPGCGYPPELFRMPSSVWRTTPTPGACTRIPASRSGRDRSASSRPGSFPCQRSGRCWSPPTPGPWPRSTGGRESRPGSSR